MEEILRQTLKLSEKNHQTHIKIPFLVTKTYTQLQIQFDYEPQVVAENLASQAILAALATYFPVGEQPPVRTFLPLFNLLTLSLSYQNMYLGCYHHKQAHQLITISHEVSSFGFLAQPVLPGEWEIQLNAHCIQSDSVCAEIVISGVK